MAKLIAIDGVDASGKQTHSELIIKKLQDLGYTVKAITFPDYESNSSSLVKMYLNGDFGKKADDVSPYVASTFFACDRFASFKTKWEEEYNAENTIIVADRYTSSNMIHQASKITCQEEKEKFLDWLYDFEFNIFKLPKPDVTIFLDMPTEFGIQLMKERANKFTNTSKKDIHESDSEYLKKSYDNACYVSKKFGWKHINCVENNQVRTIDDINTEVFNEVMKIIK